MFSSLQGEFVATMKVHFICTELSLKVLQALLTKINFIHSFVADVLGTNTNIALQRKKSLKTQVRHLPLHTVLRCTQVSLLFTYRAEMEEVLLW